METVKKYLMKSVYRKFFSFFLALIVFVLLLAFFHTPIVYFIVSISTLFATYCLLNIIIEYLFSNGVSND